MSGRGGAGRSRTLAPLVAAGTLLPGPNVLSCSVAGRDYYAGKSQCVYLYVCVCVCVYV